jgi:hypothetical protein
MTQRGQFEFNWNKNWNILHHFRAVRFCKWLIRMVARDGVEPPTPAFSGLRSTT